MPGIETANLFNVSSLAFNNLPYKANLPSSVKVLSPEDTSIIFTPISCSSKAHLTPPPPEREKRLIT
ncbi:MAG: hypothetical protein WCP69_04810 [Bacteroidota bacterium]